ncbi:AfsR/SARP family transcriptional regulator [Woodsholea maritima]|uniref:AfsR/SARP family transcriptional regulator n=1 Tax=Woodsholea maritima TaxID=240237 RepID=UPI00037E2233|nr:BTAD domain-containing putative transcriptional regulator [Woodsholea maritima]
MVAALSLHIMGPHLMRLDGKALALSVSGPSLSILRYGLIYPTQPMRRDMLMELLWEGLDPDRRRHALNSAVWRLQKALQDIEGIDLLTDKDSLRFMLAPGLRTDIQALSAAVETAEISPQSLEQLGQLQCQLDDTQPTLFGGDIEDWALSERERVMGLRIRGQILLMQGLGEQKRYEEALRYGRAILDEDPYRETVHCELMWLYVLNGQRAKAIRHFLSYRDLLGLELGIEPMAETCALFDHIRSGLNGAVTPTLCADFSVSSFHGVLHSIEQSRHDIYRALCAHTRQPA